MMVARAARRGRWALVAVLGFLATASVAADGDGGVPAPVIVVVDAQAAMQQSAAGQGLRSQHDQYRQSYQNEFDVSRKSLKEAENDLLRQKPTLSAEAWQVKAREFEQKVFEFNQRFQKANQAVEKSYRAATGDLGRAFTQVTEEVAGELGANLVLPSQQVVLQHPRMDITKTVIERLNRKFPSVTFPAPVIDGAAVPKPAPSAAKSGRK
ncbi:MAG: OmpH family outer membrane protein [Magnetospirillum sp.]|nr:OmpH family outer membrane protein [Magnetospirillum sp.]